MIRYSIEIDPQKEKEEQHIMKKYIMYPNMRLSQEYSAICILKAKKPLEGISTKREV